MVVDLDAVLTDEKDPVTDQQGVLQLRGCMALTLLEGCAYLATPLVDPLQGASHSS